ncbi:MAG TPA: phosphoenolpyruvate--protein phosphotransferase, partial [Desulfuromonadales bacterium]|nr:phosphoenolpyruvate--protein phosphotransferase [Desulfuromonadales bacterium]
MREFTGIAASPGIVVGRLMVVDRRRLAVHETSVPEEGVAAEIHRLRQAINVTRADMERLKDELEGTAHDDHLLIIDAQMLILGDERLFSETSTTIENVLINAEGALRRTLLKYRTTFEAIENAYLRDRIDDVETVVEKLLRSLTGEAHAAISSKDGLTVIAAHDISPADILQFDRSQIVGMTTEIGGRTSHASILARTFGIPAVAGVEGIADPLLDGAPV